MQQNQITFPLEFMESSSKRNSVTIFPEKRIFPKDAIFRKRSPGIRDWAARNRCEGFDRKSFLNHNGRIGAAVVRSGFWWFDRSLTLPALIYQTGRFTCLFSMIDFIQIQTTFPDESSAQACAAEMVERHLAACAQVVGPITSHYYWQDNYESGTEWICLLKTRKMLFDIVSASIRAIHPYQCPQIIAVPITDMNTPYANWLVEQTRRCQF